MQKSRHLYGFSCMRMKTALPSFYIIFRHALRKCTCADTRVFVFNEILKSRHQLIVSSLLPYNFFFYHARMLYSLLLLYVSFSVHSFCLHSYIEPKSSFTSLSSLYLPFSFISASSDSHQIHSIILTTRFFFLSFLYLSFYLDHFLSFSQIIFTVLLTPSFTLTFSFFVPSFLFFSFVFLLFLNPLLPLPSSSAICHSFTKHGRWGIPLVTS